MITPMKIENHYSSIEVQSSGAMISSAVFRPQPALQISPFFQANWKTDNDVRKSALPVILRNLGSEWACVPFGEPGIRAGLPEDWQPTEELTDWDGFPHGYS